MKTSGFNKVTLNSLVCFLLFISFCGSAHAQAQVNLKAELKNMHLWRGMQVADGMVITTDLSVADKNQYFRGGLWGGTDVNGDYKELDFYVSFTKNRFSFAIWDIYNYSPGATYNNREFFNYEARETGHFIDASLAYTISEKFPLTISWATVLYGRDRDIQNTKNLYSTLVCLDYPIWKNDKWEIKPGIGGAFALSPAKDENGKTTQRNFYGDTAGIVQVTLTTTYNLTAFKRNFPITALALFNPQSSKGYFQIGIQLFSF